MIPWKKLKAFCAAMEQKTADAAIRKDEAHAKRVNVLTFAAFANDMHAFRGEFASRLEALGCQLSTRMNLLINNLIDNRFSDFGRVVMDGFDRVKIWIEHNATLQDNTMKGYFDAYNAAAELRQEQVIAAVYGVIKFYQAEAQNQSDRYLELIELIRSMDEHNRLQHRINFDTYVSRYDNLMVIIQQKMEELHKPRIIRELGPRLEWFTENPDKIIDLGAAFSRLRENDAPPEHAKVALIRSIRTLVDFPILEVDKSLTPLLQEWGLAA